MEELGQKKSVAGSSSQSLGSSAFPFFLFFILCSVTTSIPAWPLQENMVILAGFQPCLLLCHAAALLTWRVRPVASKLSNAQCRPPPTPTPGTSSTWETGRATGTCQIRQI